MNVPRRCAYLVAAVLALSIAHDLFRMPIQVSDSLGEILDAQAAPSAAAVFAGSVGTTAYLRPLRLAQIKALFDLSAGHYHLAYRGFHSLLVLSTVLLFTRALRVATWTDLAAAALALTVLLGGHTFAGTVREAYPINHFLEILMLSLLVLNLAQGGGGWMTDAAAALIFVVAALTLESGLLVWVVAAVAWWSGMRGVSRRGVLAMTLLVAGYLCLRFGVLGTGTPSLTERSSGFLLTMLEPEELQARFAGHPLPFYVYNVATSVLSVLFAEPRAGVWVAVGSWLNGDVPPWVLLAVVTSTLTTVLVAMAAYGRIRERLLDGHDRLLVLFGAVLAANVLLSYAYTKSEILSVAGGFYALAVYAAVRRFLAAEHRPRRRVALVALALLLASAATGWAIRSAGLHYALGSQAFKQRNEWVTASAGSHDTPQARALVRRLRADALERRVVAPRFTPRWAARWFEE